MVWELPSELGQLAQLYDLGLSGNQLTELPPELGQLQNLTHLLLEGNPLEGCLPVAWRDAAIAFQSWRLSPFFCTE